MSQALVLSTAALLLGAAIACAQAPAPNRTGARGDDGHPSTTAVPALEIPVEQAPTGVIRTETSDGKPMTGVWRKPPVWKRSSG